MLFSRLSAAVRPGLSLGLVVLSILVLSCSSGGDGNGTDPDLPRLFRVSVSPTSVSFDALGDTRQLTAVARDQFGQVMPNVSYLWVSANPAIAAVTPSGLVTSVGIGSSEVWAQAEARRDTASVEVTQVALSSELVSGDNQIHWTGFVLPDTLEIRIQDRVGTPVVGTAVEWEILSGGGARLVLNQNTDEEGRSKAIWLLGLGESGGSPGQGISSAFQQVSSGAGMQQVSATVAGLDPVIFEATAYDPTSVLNQGPLSLPMLDTLEVRFSAVDSLGDFQTGIPFELQTPTGFGEIVPGPTATGVNGELLVKWVLGPTPGNQVFTAVRADIGRLVQVEAEGTGQVDPWPFTMASTGLFHTCAIDDMGTAYCWGRGLEWQLGDADTLDVNQPKLVSTALTWAAITGGDSHSCGLTDTDSQIHCWGEGFQTGQATGLPVPTPVQVPGGPWTALTSGAEHVCAIGGGSQAFCWGEEVEGRLGIGDGILLPTEVPSPVAGGHTWSHLSAGWRHTCGRESDLKAYCWGRGGEGQLGDGPAVDRTVPVEVAGGFEWRTVSAGYAHSCGISVDKDAYCWGEGSRDELGDGSGTDQSSPVKVAGGHEWDVINAGRFHTCAIDTGGKLYCWGSRGTQSGRPWLVGIGPFGSPIPAAVRSNLTFKSVQTQGTHTCAVTTDNQAYCWGDGDFGQLGVRSILDFDVPRQVFRGMILP